MIDDQQSAANGCKWCMNCVNNHHWFYSLESGSAYNQQPELTTSCQPSPQDRLSTDEQLRGGAPAAPATQVLELATALERSSTQNRAALMRWDGDPGGRNRPRIRVVLDGAWWGIPWLPWLAFLDIPTI